MRFAISISCVTLLVLVSMAAVPVHANNPKPVYKIEDAPALFEKFIKDYNRTYKNAEDRRIHYDAFVKTLESINRLNTDPSQGTGTFGINKFADYTEEEQKKMYGFNKQ